MPAKSEITDITRATVVDSLKDGKKPAEVAKMLGMNARTFRRHFDAEIKAHSTGNAKYKKSPKDTRIVKGMVGLGAPKAQIAKCLGINVKTLNEHYTTELMQTAALNSAQVYNSLIKLCTGKTPNLKAIELFLKCQEGWIEKEKELKQFKPAAEKKGKKEQQKDQARDVAEGGIYGVPPTPPGLKVVGGNGQ